MSPLFLIIFIISGKLGRYETQDNQQQVQNSNGYDHDKEEMA